jgi:hypothetical protein
MDHQSGEKKMPQAKLTARCVSLAMAFMAALVAGCEPGGGDAASGESAGARTVCIAQTTDQVARLRPAAPERAIAAVNEQDPPVPTCTPVREDVSPPDDTGAGGDPPPDDPPIRAVVMAVEAAPRQN